MKKLGFLIFVLALVVGVIAANMGAFGRFKSRMSDFSFHVGGEKGSGNVVTEKRDLSGFKNVNVSNAFQVEIVAQKDFAVEVEADDNLLPLIRTEVDGDTLKIECEGKISTSNSMKIRISAPDIEELDTSGAVNLTLTGLKNAGLHVDSSGASKIKLSGETSKLVIEVSGTTRVDADELKAENGTVEASGASNVSVNVAGSLRSDASGASRISYAGTPRELVKKSSGASSVSQK